MRTTVTLIALAGCALGQSVLPQPEPHAVEIGVAIAPLALSGRIVMANGVLPPEAVLIDYSGPAGSFAFWSDARGQFSIPVEKLGLPALPNRAVPNFNGVKLRFKLAGVAENTIALDRIQTVEELKLAEVRLTPQSAALLSNGSYGAPPSAHKLYTRGMEQFTAGKYSEALGAFNRAIAAYPKYAAAFEWRGRALEKLDRRADAIESYRRAADVDPKFVQPLIELATLASQVQDSAEAVRWAERVNRLAPDSYPQMYLVSATANYNLEHLEAAESAGRVGLAIDHRHAYPALHRIVGETLHARRNYAAARSELAAYLSAVPNAADAAEIRALIVECDAHLKL